MKADTLSKIKSKLNIKDWILLFLTLLITVVLLWFFPGKTDSVISSSVNYFLEMIFILPAVMILMGLFKVWISKELVVKYLGKSSGLKGILLAIILGSTPTGPLYVAYPIAKTMLDKGARVMNIIVFLSAWACIKIPQEMVELQFLEIRFMSARLILTIPTVIIMGFIIEKILKK